MVSGLMATAVFAEETESNPVRKIITLLQKMQEKTQDEGRQEDELYKKFKCFCSKNKEEIGENGEELRRKMDSMEAAIQEHSAAAETFKQRVADAKREREEAQAALAQAQAVRQKESEEFVAQNEAGNMDVSAMKKAVGLLSGKATKEELLQAVGDARLKKIVLTAQGVSDFERDTISSFLANPYGNHQNDPVRGEVTGMLNQMIETMEGDLKSGNEAEAAAAQAFEEMRVAKNAEIDSLSKQIETGTQRQGEEAVAAANMKTQFTDAQNSFGADLEFMERLTENCATKETEYGERKKIRAEELTAVTEVIGMLNNDDSLMKFHTAKQHTSFLQIVKNDDTAKQVARAYAMIRGMSSTPRFSFLAYSIKHAVGKFDNVIKIINDMISLVDEEQSNDDTHREHCTSEFHRNEKEHMTKTNDIDGLDQKISSLEENIAGMKVEVEEKEKIIGELDEAVATATEQRKSEHSEYNVLVKDTDVALVLLGKAKNRLAKFYNPNLHKEAPQKELSEEEKIIAASTPNFLQRALRRNMIRDDREPAPDTWNGDYKTKAQGSSGVVALMDTLLHELEETKTVAKTDEANSQTEYEGFMEESKKNKAETEQAKTHLKAELEDTAESLNNDQSSIASAKEEMGDIIQETADLHAECDFLIQNYDFRQEARGTERESLVTALHALNGAEVEAEEPEAEADAQSFLQQDPIAEEVGGTGEAQAEVDVDTQKIMPFGAQDVAQELTENSGDAQSTLVDAIENSEVAEIKRSVFRSLTRLRAATVKEYDTIARLETQAIDAYNDAHHYTAENPINPLGGGDASTDSLSSFH